MALKLKAHTYASYNCKNKKRWIDFLLTMLTEAVLSQAEQLGLNVQDPCFWKCRFLVNF